MKKFLLVFLGLIAPLAASATELVVIESTATSYAPGDTITDEDTITLEQGTKIILLSEDGMVIGIPGPFNGPLTPIESEDDYDVLRTLGVLVGQSEVDARSIGGVRFGGVEYTDIDPTRDVTDGRESPWFVHSGIGGTQCVPQDAEQVTYWREDSSQEQRLSVRHLASGDSAAVPWRSGENTLSWPDKLSMSLDEVYVLRMDDDLRSVALVIRAIPDAVGENDYATVAWLAAKGCTSQAKLALARLQ